MATEPARKGPAISTGTVLRSERLTPHLIRVVLGGPGLDGFAAGEFTDHYVKLLFPRPGVTYPDPFDMAVIRADFPRDQWPVTRTYTVRAFENGELTLDFVYHGDEGLAGPWAANAAPGDEIRFLGPGGAYTPDPEAGWHLLAGDESALPAIAASLERVPGDVPAHVFVEVADASEELDLKVPGATALTWLHRGDAPVGAKLTEAVRALDFPDGTIHAFVHGEAGFVKELRRFLRVERGIPLDRLSISGYWRVGRDEDGWQSSKRDWNRQVEEEESAALKR
ncbi:siderophore-interacting protein [Actinomadura flavalba]|uniref:siderophore-interacting protein n=1 Tax=Actinomadura flavalba TaxID=1120938 RepID=UPI00039AE9E1|nr:siderophore-interacting protein [Actinomadura flavalba]